MRRGAVASQRRAGARQHGQPATTEAGGGSSAFAPDTAAADVTLRGQRIVFSGGSCRREGDGSFVVDTRVQADRDTVQVEEHLGGGRLTANDPGGTPLAGGFTCGGHGSGGTP